MAGLSTRQFQDLAGHLTTPDGGYSVDSKTGDWGPRGYYVAQRGGERAFPPSHTVTGSDVARHSWDTEGIGEVPGHRRSYLGGWNDPASGSVYLDRSVRHSSLARGMQRAIANRQLAIYGTHEGRSLDNPMERDARIPSQLKEHQAGVAQSHFDTRGRTAPSPEHIDPTAWAGH